MPWFPSLANTIRIAEIHGRMHDGWDPEQEQEQDIALEVSIREAV
jgi:hypothetical protein